MATSNGATSNGATDSGATDGGATSGGGGPVPAGTSGRPAPAPAVRRPAAVAAKIPDATVTLKTADVPVDDMPAAAAPAPVESLRVETPALPEISSPAAMTRAVLTTTSSDAGTVAVVENAPAEVVVKMENKVMKTAEEFVSFGQGNVEAFMKAGQIWAAGFQDLGKQFAATAQAHFDESVSVFKALSGVKSLKEAIDLQSSLARSSLEKAVAETSKMTDASMKLAEQALAPITARMTLAVEKFGRAA